jgi:hypothetical protein
MHKHEESGFNKTSKNMTKLTTEQVMRPNLWHWHNFWRYKISGNCHGTAQVTTLYFFCSMHMMGESHATISTHTKTQYLEDHSWYTKTKMLCTWTNSTAPHNNKVKHPFITHKRNRKYNIQIQQEHKLYQH